MFLDKTEVLHEEIITMIGRITVIFAGGAAVFGFFQNKQKKIEYTYLPSIKKVFLLMSIGTAFTIVAVYLCLHLPVL